MTRQPDDLNDLNDLNDLDDLLQRGFRYALSLCHDRGAAEELLQEACLRLSRKRGPWRFRYLATVIRNHHIDQRRRSQKVTFEPLAETDVEGSLSNVLGDDELQRALGQLKPDHRELLYLAVVEGYTSTELAELTGQPRGTVLSVLHRAKQKLRERLANSGDRRAL